MHGKQLKWVAVIATVLSAAACGDDDSAGGNANVTGANGSGGMTGSAGSPQSMGSGGSARGAGSGGNTTTGMAGAAGSGGVGTGSGGVGTGSGGVGTGSGGVGTGSGGVASTDPMGASPSPTDPADPSTCPKPPASASPEAITALDAINRLRLAVGSGCATMADALNMSAKNHCDYYAANASNMMCIADPHAEVASCTGFTGADLGTRMKAAGYTGRGSSEVMAFLNNPQGAVDTWVNSVWHRIPILDPWTAELGYGNAASCDTIDFGQGTPMPDDTVVVYPYDQQTGIATEFDGSREGPMPPAPSTGWPSSSPINVYAKMLTVTSHVLTLDSDSTPIDHVWLTSKDSQFLRNGVMMYANKPFAAMTKYRVQVVGTRAGTPVNLEWTFTTGAAPMRWPGR